MKIRSRDDDEPVLNLTPMIDVVFQLLIFFMVATTFLDPEKEIGIELPEAVAGDAADTEREELVINVFADGRIVMAGQELPADELLGALKAAARSDPQVPVTIRGDRLVHHESIVAVMDAAGSERATLVGASEGGPATILFAATHPDRTEALVLIGAMARSTYSDDHPWLPAVTDFQQSGEQFLMPVWGSGAAIETAAPSRSDDPEALAWCGRLERSISPGMIASVAAMFYDTDVRAVLPSIRVPTLVLHRRGDRLVNIRSGRYVAEHIPGALIVEIPGTDHFPFFQNSDRFADEIEKFVTGSTPPTVPDRRLATVFFSDIVGSTERAAALGDARWRDLLAAENP